MTEKNSANESINCCTIYDRAENLFMLETKPPWPPKGHSIPEMKEKDQPPDGKRIETATAGW